MMRGPRVIVTSLLGLSGMGCNALIGLGQDTIIEGDAATDSGTDATLGDADAGTACANGATWQATGSLPVATVFGSPPGLLAVLGDGRVLAAGGESPQAPALSTAELYDPVAGMWTATGPTKVAGRARVLLVLPGGKALMAGGDTGNGACTADSEVYDPDAGAWSTTGPLGAPRCAGHLGVLLPTGKVLVAGGAEGPTGGSPYTSTELYDPSAGTWSDTGSLHQMRVAPAGLIALPDGNALIVGGTTAAPVCDPSVLSTAELYDPASGAWTVTGSSPTPHGAGYVTLLGNGLVLAAGGQTCSTANAGAELFDPKAGTWTPTAPMPAALQYMQGTVLADGRVLVMGGSAGGLNGGTFLYDPVAGSWSSGPSLPFKVETPGVVTLDDGRVLVAGGEGAASETAACETLACGAGDSGGSSP